MPVRVFCPRNKVCQVVENITLNDLTFCTQNVSQLTKHTTVM